MKRLLYIFVCAIVVLIATDSQAGRRRGGGSQTRPLCYQISGTPTGLPTVSEFHWLPDEAIADINAVTNYSAVSVAKSNCTGIQPGKTSQVANVFPTATCDHTVLPPGGTPVAHPGSRSDPSVNYPRGEDGVNPGEVAAGETICLRGGEYTVDWTPDYPGTVGNEIIIQPQQGYGTPHFVGANITFGNAAAATYVQMIGRIRMRDEADANPNSSIIIKGSSSDILIHNVGFSSNQLGISVETTAGDNISISKNSFDTHSTHHIGIDRHTANTDGNEGLIQGNTFINAWENGVDLVGNFWIVRYNQFIANGLITGEVGHSAIHLVTHPSNNVHHIPPSSGCDGVEDVNYCDSNQILSNTIRNTREEQADGHAIILDQFCDFNTVSSNMAYTNDAAVVSNFDAKTNTVTWNSGYHNSRDGSALHSVNADMLVSGDSNCDYQRVVGSLTWEDNFVFTGRTAASAEVKALRIDSWAGLSSAQETAVSDDNICIKSDADAFADNGTGQGMQTGICQ